jgi:hypothetical protein
MRAHAESPVISAQMAAATLCEVESRIPDQGAVGKNPQIAPMLGHRVGSGSRKLRVRQDAK